MKRLIIIIVFGLTLASYVSWQISKSRTFQFFGTLVTHGNTADKVVALTFDDAPSGNTEEVLNILADKHMKATFYVVGAAAEQHKDALKAIVQQGHELGNHSFSHRRMIFKTPGTIKTEIEKTNQLLRQAGYTGEITFRPPYGKKFLVLPRYLAQQHIRTVLWDVEPDTYAGGDAEKLVQYTLKHIKPGSIVLMHPFSQSEGAADRLALAGIIEGVRRLGYRWVLVSELIKITPEK